MKVFKRKQVVLLALVCMVALAGYFNWNYKNAENGTVHDTREMALGEARLVSSTKATEADYFSSARMERDTGRSKAMESLKSIAQSTSGTNEAAVEAERQLISMALRIEKEAAAEAEIKAKGFSDCVVYINESAVTVVVKKEGELNAKDAAKIQEIIVRLTDIDTSLISISNY